MYRLATAALAFTLLVILWGAFVRATGSGAGCGSHWPTCNGEIIPRAPSTQTLIEYTHRLTSGLAFLLVFAQWLVARRRFARGTRVRWAALASFTLMITEALIGGGLVIFEMVAGNTETARAIWMMAHLLNTFSLLAALALTWWWSGPGALPAGGTTATRAPGRPPFARLILTGTVALLLVAATGAVAALGDTLFPARSLSEGLADDLAPGAHLFVRLRALHPFFAVGTGFFLLVVLAVFAGGTVGQHAGAYPPGSRRLAGVSAALVCAQLLAGVINLLMLAPIWLQLVHLLLADILWICLVLVCATLFCSSIPSRGDASTTGKACPAPFG